MKTFQTHWTPEGGWTRPLPQAAKEYGLALVFASTSLLKTKAQWKEIRAAFPEACLFGCSTSGEICGTRVADDSIVVTAVRFERTPVRHASIRIEGTDSQAMGRKLADLLDKKDLKHVFVLSNGVRVNGSELVKGLSSGLPKGVAVTGGLAGDGARFQETFVAAGAEPEDDVVGAVGFYGDKIRIGYGSLGGWDPFGPERLITRSAGNVLYELDGKSALELYKNYLGEHAQGLPATGLLFPLSLRTADGETPVVRTIVGVDEKEKTMTFAGNVPEGSKARLMKANFDRLIDGAAGAAKTSHGAVTDAPELAILISCVGRKLILKQRVEEEVEGVREVLGEKAVLTGFYSYGEISPFTPGAKCELHNQTMTITTLREIGE